MGVFLTSPSQLGAVYWSCDPNETKKVTLEKRATCLLDHTEAWFHTVSSNSLVATEQHRGVRQVTHRFS